MKSMKRILFCVLAALLPTGWILPTSALAANFIVKKQGNGLILGHNVGELSFSIPGEGTVSCKEATVMGTAEAALNKPFEFQLVSIKYVGCALHGTPFGATVSEAMFDYNANGSVRVVEKEEEHQAAKPIKIFVQGCEVTIGESGNGTLKTVEYVNLAKGEVEVVSKLTGITAEESLACPNPGVTKAAEYTGKIVIMEEGGEIEVK